VFPFPLLDMLARLLLNAAQHHTEGDLPLPLTPNNLLSLECCIAVPGWSHSDSQRAVRLGPATAWRRLCGTHAPTVDPTTCAQPGNRILQPQAPPFVHGYSQATG